MTIIRDIICQVYAGDKNIEVIYIVLNSLLPDYEQLNLDYACKPEDREYVFRSEREMVLFFIDNKNIEQVFYWNKYHNNPDKIMIGAIITKDDKLIVSLTFDGEEEKINYYFQKLKEIVKTNIGVVSYIFPADYNDGKDFCEKYK